MSNTRTIRKAASAILAVFLTAAVLTGCGKDANDPANAKIESPVRAKKESPVTAKKEREKIEQTDSAAITSDRVFSVAKDVPTSPSGAVVDCADAFTPDEEMMLASVVEHFEQATDGELRILTVQTTGDVSIEEFSLEIANKWKIGQAGKDNGVLFTLAIQDRRNRLEVGYGFESILTATRCGDVLKSIVPELREGKYAEACAKAVRSLEAFFSDAMEYTSGIAAWEKKDFEAAVKCFRAAAEQGSTDAMVLYADLLSKGKGVAKDEAAAMDWLKKAADAGNSTAQVLYGNALISQDRKSDGLAYMKRSADSGNVLGLYFLGGVYLEMTREEKSLGFECMKNAASMPLTEKKSVIDYIDGLSVAFGGDLDLDEKLNNNTNRIIVQAQYIVGSLYRSGELPGGRNMDESLKWMNKAKENGSAEAATYLKMIEMMQKNQGH